jgi:hypothetical protein
LVAVHGTHLLSYPWPAHRLSTSVQFSLVLSCLVSVFFLLLFLFFESRVWPTSLFFFSYFVLRSFRALSFTRFRQNRTLRSLFISSCSSVRSFFAFVVVRVVWYKERDPASPPFVGTSPHLSSSGLDFDSDFGRYELE